VVRRSHNGLHCDADTNYDSIYGPQTKNARRLLNNINETPISSSDKNQLAIKGRKLTRRVDRQLVGTILYRTVLFGYVRSNKHFALRIFNK
jgi:hypothetical protein